MDMREINERLKDILASEGCGTKDIDVANALEINPNRYAQMKFRGTIPYREIMDFLARRKISINLFFYNQRLNEESEGYRILKLIKGQASLGGGAWSAEEESEEVVLGRAILERLQLRGGELEMIAVSGDSMEPYILEGDLCIVERGAVESGEICVVSTPLGVVVKRLYFQGKELLLLSHNPLYSPQKYYTCECFVIGRVVGLVRGVGE